MIKRTAQRRTIAAARSARQGLALLAILPLGIALSDMAFAASLVEEQADGSQEKSSALTGEQKPGADSKTHKPGPKPDDTEEHKGKGDVTLAETKVTSTMPVKNPRLLSPVPETGITREEFGLRNNRRLGDVIQRLPGVLVDGPTGSNQDVRLRGLDKEFTRVQVDGVQLPNGGEKREFQVNQLPSFMVGQVNVIRNSTADFESDGLAGRVDIKTREIPTEPKLEARFGYGGRDDMNGDLINGQLGFGFNPSTGSAAWVLSIIWTIFSTATRTS